MSKNILIIGGSGFIGTTLTDTLLRAGHHITLLNRGRKKVADCAQLIADRNSISEMERCREEAGTFDVVIDTSCYTLQQCELAWRFFSPKSKHWIHISSAAVYAEKDVVLGYDESDPIGGAQIWGKYGADKSEIDLWLIHASDLKPVTILRPPYIYGPGNDIDRETFIWARALSDLPILIPGDGNAVVQFLHVSDLTHCILSCMANVPQTHAVYNVASDEQVSLREWVELLVDISGGNKKNIHLLINGAGDLNPRLYFPFRNTPIRLSTERAWVDLGWRASYTLEKGFGQTFKTYTIEQLKKYAERRSNEEVEIVARLRG